MSELETIDIFKLDISPRLRNILRRNGILNMREAGKYTKYDYIRFRNMGEKTLQELVTICEQYGIEIKDK